MRKRPIYRQVIERLQEPRKFIQVLLGPRQIGKTTLILQVAEDLEQSFHYISADLEVDFVLRLGKSVTAIGVKSGNHSLRPSGMDAFVDQFHPQRVLLIGKEGISPEQFLSTHPSEWIS